MSVQFSNPSNHLPSLTIDQSILSNVAKVFEIILYSHIRSAISQNVFLFQHGFMERPSTVTNHTCFVQYVVETLDSQNQVDVPYTDFDKAFDKVDHNIILRKLASFGFHINLVF